MLIKSGSSVLASQCQDGSLLTIDARANIQHWEIVPSNLQISLDAWSQQVNRSGEHSLDIEYLKDGKTDLSEPKHGKVDPENKPHVGGNQWAGGSGGRDTAGLGGIGGPYRLDAGHQVYQVPDDVKAAVPDHVRKAARELGQKVFKERLKEIEMSEYEHDTYEKYMNKIASEIKLLRAIIESLEAKSHDRQWVVSSQWCISVCMFLFSCSAIVPPAIGMSENWSRELSARNRSTSIVLMFHRNRAVLRPRRNGFVSS